MSDLIIDGLCEDLLLMDVEKYEKILISNKRQEVTATKGNKLCNTILILAPVLIEQTCQHNTIPHFAYNKLTR